MSSPSLPRVAATLSVSTQHLSAFHTYSTLSRISRMFRVSFAPLARLALMSLNSPFSFRRNKSVHDDILPFEHTSFATRGYGGKRAPRRCDVGARRHAAAARAANFGPYVFFETTVDRRGGGVRSSAVYRVILRSVISRSINLANFPLREEYPSIAGIAGLSGRGLPGDAVIDRRPVCRGILDSARVTVRGSAGFGSKWCPARRWISRSTQVSDCSHMRIMVLNLSSILASLTTASSTFRKRCITINIRWLWKHNSIDIDFIKVKVSAVDRNKHLTRLL